MQNIIVGKHVITKTIWALSLIKHKDKQGHVYLILEGVDAQGNRVIEACHLARITSNPEFAEVIVERFSSFAQIESLVKNCTSYTTNITQKRLEQLKDLIRNTKKNKIVYQQIDEKKPSKWMSVESISQTASPTSVTNAIFPQSFNAYSWAQFIFTELKLFFSESQLTPCQAKLLEKEKGTLTQGLSCIEDSNNNNTGKQAAPNTNIQHKDSETSKSESAPKNTASQKEEVEDHEVLLAQESAIELTDPKEIDFKDQRPFASGGYGWVYRMTWRGKDVAVKKLNMASALNGQVYEKLTLSLKQEINLIKQLDSPYIIKLLAYSCAEEPYLIMDYMVNGSLYDYIQSHQAAPMPWPVRIQIALEIGQGLAYLHQQQPKPLLHRDLKSQNVLLDGGLHAKLTDFGLSKFKDNFSHTSTEGLKGTMAYMAPELLQTGNTTPQTDIFSYGIVLWELAAYQEPHADLKNNFNKNAVIMTRILIEKKREEIPVQCEREQPRLAKLIKFCWDENPHQRSTAMAAVNYLAGKTEGIESSSTPNPQQDSNDNNANQNSQASLSV